MDIYGIYGKYMENIWMNKNYGHILRFKIVRKNHTILNNYSNSYSVIECFLFNVFLKLKNIFTKCRYIFHKKIFNRYL